MLHVLINHQMKQNIQPCKTILVICFSLLLILNSTYSQETGICGTEDETSSGSSLTPCFNVEDVWDNDLPVYVKVNVHFILNDDCSGSIHPNPTAALDQRFGYRTAEEMINSVNDMMEIMEDETQWNQAEWNVTVTEPRATHFRFVLKGVYFHCNSAAKSSSYNHILNLGVNKDEEINIFLVWIPGEVIGYVHGSAGLKSETFANWCIGHEIGHIFGLNHSFTSTQCPDTWVQSFEWDNDCDNINNIVNNKCWATYNVLDKSVPPDGIYENIDVNSDGLYTIPPDFIENFCLPHPQGGTPPCFTHPCCEWRRQDNNLMGYSQWSRNQEYTALSPCQLEIMLERASTSRCDYIEQIGGIPPPSAFISILPLDDLREAYCSYCLRLEASVNDDYYKLDIYDNSNSILLTTTDWLPGPAELYCIKTIQEKNSNTAWFGGFLPTHEYTAILTVKNSADIEDTFTLLFTTPETQCYELAEDNFIVSPSPATSNNINFQYILPFSADVNIFAAHANYGMYSGLLTSANGQSAGSHDFGINISNWYSGVNFIIIQINDEVYSTAIVKP